MEILNYSQARAHLAETFDRVCRDHAPVIVTRRGASPIVIMSLEDFGGISETTYLTAIPANKRELDRSLEELKKGKIVKKSLKELEDLIK